MRVKHVMTKDPTCCVPSDKAPRAASIMRDENVGSVPVIENEQSQRIVGIVTDRDLCMNIVAEGRDPNNVYRRGVHDRPRGELHDRRFPPEGDGADAGEPRSAGSPSWTRRAGCRASWPWPTWSPAASSSRRRPTTRSRRSPRRRPRRASRAGSHATRGRVTVSSLGGATSRRAGQEYQISSTRGAARTSPPGRRSAPRCRAPGGPAPGRPSRPAPRRGWAGSVASRTARSWRAPARATRCRDPRGPARS